LAGNWGKKFASNCLVRTQKPMARDNPMAIVRFNALWFAVALAILGSCSFAQDQDPNGRHVKKKWLFCDVDWIFTPYDVGPDFSIKLSFHQAPLPATSVVLTPGGELTDASGRGRVPVAAVTDSSGTAHFLSVPPGKYTAGAKNGLSFPSNEVTVHADGDFDNEISIEWPLDPLPVHTLRGKLTAPGQGDNAERPFQFATVELVDLRSSRVIEKQRTISDGSYEFSTTEPGLYAFRVIPPAKERRAKPETGDLVVELDPAAKEPTIPEMKVLQSDCAGVQLSRSTAKD
jgi:hypothetical protein